MIEKPDRALSFDSQVASGSASNEDVLLPFVNALNLRRGRRYSSTSNSAILTLTLSAAGVGRRVVLIDNHDIDPAATINVSYGHASGAQNYNITFRALRMARLDDLISEATTDITVTITQASGTFKVGFIGVMRVWELLLKTKVDRQFSPIDRVNLQDGQDGRRSADHLFSRKAWTEQIPGLCVDDVDRLEDLRLSVLGKATPFYYHHRFALDIGDFDQVRMMVDPAYRKLFDSAGNEVGREVQIVLQEEL